MTMAKKLISWKTKGMNRDTSVSAFNPEFAFENINLRLSTNEGNTMMSWVNERGTKEMTLSIYKNGFNVGGDSSNMYLSSFIGVPIGTAIINHQLVVFTYDAYNTYWERNYIYVLTLSRDKNTFEGKILYAGDLNMDSDHPLETLVSYESENVQKVYWTDGINQPRMLNIKSSRMPTTIKASFFDFVPELNLKESVYVYKLFGSGEFPAGVIQYAFTYYNKYGQESNVFHTTPLQYISYVDRGGSPESKIANSFKIEVYHIDQNFDYLRVYSILRTSKDATPFCKRVQDIEINGSDSITFIDNGLQGESIDPTELLYKGGERIFASTLEQKDGTLFLGNIKMTRPQITVKDNILTANGVSKSEPLARYNVSSETVLRPFTLVSQEPFTYANTLSCPNSDTYDGIAGFKAGEYYRLGVQFQYKDGKWSEPCWIGDSQETVYPRFIGDASDQFSEGVAGIYVPGFKYTLSSSILSTLYNDGYKRARPVMAVPNFTDRTILCQGVGCPTVYRIVDRYANIKNINVDGNKGRLYAQSSWLFRCPVSFGSSIEDGDAANGGGKVSYAGFLKTQFDNPMLPEEPPTSSNYKISPYLRDTEVMGYFDSDNSFTVDPYTATIHSPDIEFDTAFSSIDFTKCSVDLVGTSYLVHTYGDISIQTSTPPIGSDAAGFIHRSIVTDGSAALISAPFYNDYLVYDLEDDKYGAYMTKNPAVYFPVYMWHKNGSLNNDVSRTNRSAELLKKVISNYRLGDDTSYRGIRSNMDYEAEDIQLFNSDELGVSKVAGNVYMGNIETMLTPSKPSRHYFIGSPYSDVELSDYFNFDSYQYLGLADPSNTDSTSGVWTWGAKDGHYTWVIPSNKYSSIGKHVKGLCQWREPISMKYKSTPHLVAKLKYSIYGYGSSVISNGYLPVVEVSRAYSKNTFFGGTSDEALKAATWIPCGSSVYFDGSSSINLHYKWGDTYFQRVECLKTYPFTHEDKNQVVEIASFMCETRVNMDGRYDRNRAQTSNLNMTPQNFNLINPVYSQMDNFFSYKMLDEDDYKNVTYPNNITWTKTKESGADVDLWTNITMANVLEMDGDKGTVNKLTRLNNQLLCFQDSGISQILYNENTQISTTEGVPIEIANSEKVQGKRYLSDTVGCSNKWSMAQTPNGIYFMDSNDKSIYLFNGQLNNLSITGGFNAWSKQHIPSAEMKWKPSDFEGDGKESFVAYYDKLNQDVLFINNDTALAYSEKFNCFTSFYDYGGSPFFENLDDVGIWIRGNKIWKHQAGEYGRFFDENKPFSMTLIANQEPQLDKIFTNVEFRACVGDEGTYDESGKAFTPSLPFDFLEAWDEYQHGITTLNNRNKDRRLGHGMMDSLLARKFRIWRCDVPRDNADVDAATEAPLGIKRFKKRSLDRLRNTWAYLKLGKYAAPVDDTLSKTEIHDIMATYFA